MHDTKICLSFQMARSYGALSVMNARPLNIFVPDIQLDPCPISSVKNLPVVKDQGSQPVCAAVVVLTMYEQLLLRENIYSLWDKRTELGWGWIYVVGQEILHNDDFLMVQDQLLSGLPLVTALFALISRGVWTPPTPGVSINDPVTLSKYIQEMKYSPIGNLAVPLRFLSVLPTTEALIGALQSQYVIGFAFSIDSVIDQWMHSKELQEATSFELPDPQLGSTRLATHAAVITAIDLDLDRATVQNSFGSSFGTLGFFFIPMRLLLRPFFSNLEFYILLRAG